jgi:hypothetical protein
METPGTDSRRSTHQSPERTPLLAGTLRRHARQFCCHREGRESGSGSSKAIKVGAAAIRSWIRFKSCVKVCLAAASSSWLISLMRISRSELNRVVIFGPVSFVQWGLRLRFLFTPATLPDWSDKNRPTTPAGVNYGPKKVIHMRHTGKHSRLRNWSERRLAEMRERGIKFVQVLGCNNPGDDCEACLAMKDHSVEIEYAPTLPLPGCTMKKCKCVIIAVEK